MASPPLRGSVEWSAEREVKVLLGLTRGNYYAAQRLWLQKERYKAEASQVASAGSPQASQRAAGCQAKPTTAKAQDVPKPKRKKSAARLAKDQRRLNQKRLASKMWAYVRVASRLLAWSVRARVRCALNRARWGCEAQRALLDKFVTTAKARDVPKPKRKKSAARLAKDRKRLNHKHLASKVWAFVRVARKLIAWSRRARANLERERREASTPPVTPTRPSVTVTESAAAPCSPLLFPQPEGLFTSITVLPFYQDKSFEELRWEHYSKGDVRGAPPAEPPAAAQPAPPSQQPSAALVAAARASLDASELQDDRGSKRDPLARTPPSAAAPERPPPPADARKRPASRGGAQLEAALARAAPTAEPGVQPATAENYAAHALAAAANPVPAPPPEAPPQAPLYTDAQRCPSQRPRLPRHPRWRSSPQVHATTLPAAGTAAYPLHTHASLISPPSLTAYTRLPTSTAPPHRAYPTRRRRPTCARPTPPLLSHPTAPPDLRQTYPTAPSHIHGAAPPRLSHPTAPPDPRQPHPTRSPTAQPHPTRSLTAQPHLTRSLTAQPHPTPYRARTRNGSECQGQSAPLPSPLPRKGPPSSNRAAPREAWGLPQSRPVLTSAGPVAPLLR
eukprot:CAMPEP_0118846688 /NCGR_PEP_ID=MMETSP1162-20130426/92588_1 /TAXON_ID=33656 /ORGANISM="Phaeocystis Sp, Strain CCMP2710" /LENGTH=618 /DNA_ID=CAMNT_0006778873 /DNA_START=60 /DNA_END=1916 /DNA_ORIENTATION=+